MSFNLTRVNSILKNNISEEVGKETEIVLSGPQAMANILANETTKIFKLNNLSDRLINSISNDRKLFEMNIKDRRDTLRTISEIQSKSTDFLVKITELANKNAILQEIIKVSKEPKQLIRSVNGEAYISEIDDERRRELSELLRDLVTEKSKEL